MRRHAPIAEWFRESAPQNSMGGDARRGCLERRCGSLRFFEFRNQSMIKECSSGSYEVDD
jgi:hypothetical protein